MIKTPLCERWLNIYDYEHGSKPDSSNQGIFQAIDQSSIKELTKPGETLPATENASLIIQITGVDKRRLHPVLTIQFRERLQRTWFFSLHENQTIEQPSRIRASESRRHSVGTTGFLNPSCLLEDASSGRQRPCQRKCLPQSGSDNDGRRSKHGHLSFG